MEFWKQGTLIEARNGEYHEKTCRSKRSFDQGKVMEQMRRVITSTCQHCGIEIEGIAIKKFCSNACRQRNKRLKAKQAA